MVVEDDHDVCASQSGDDGIHDVHGVLSLELRIGRDGVVGHKRIALERLIGPRQPNGVHAEFLDLANDGSQRSVIQSPGHVLLFIEAEPIDRCEPDRMSSGIQNLMAAGVERRRDHCCLRRCDTRHETEAKGSENKCLGA